MTFWKFKGLAQMFSAMLMGVGIIVWSVRKVRERILQKKLATAFSLTMLLAGLLSWAGHIAFWETTFTAIFTSIFFILAASYVWLIVYPENFVDESDITPEVLRERWAQQIGEAAAQQERNRLARELHDSVKQQLFSIQVAAATTQARWESDPAGALAAVDELRARTRDAMAEMEAMLHNLRPAPLPNFGLVEALRRECEALRLRTGAQVETVFTDLPDEMEFPPGTQETLFRCGRRRVGSP